MEAVYKGNYPTLMSDTIAAARAHKAPDIAVIFDAGTNTFMSSKGAYKPVHELMKKYKLSFSTSDFVGGAASYYETADNQLDSMPFNSSAPVLYYNKSIMKKAGISKPPATWQDLMKDAPKVVKSGTKCVYTPSGTYIMWTDLEEFSTWNGLQFATQDNGYNSIKNVKLDIDKAAFVKHMNNLGKLAKEGELFWAGTKQGSATTTKFDNGECAFYVDSSSSVATVKAGAKFPYGIAPMMTVAGDKKAPQNAVVGGASIWVMAGAPENHYQGDAEFLHFLMSNPAQKYWASNTGYIPVTNSINKQLKGTDFFKTHAADKVAVQELNNKKPLPYTRGIRLGFLPKVRQAEATAFSSVFSGKESAQQALTTAANKGDQILKQFATQYGG